MLGEVLRKAREEQNLTIEDLERETSIRKAYIAAIEEENFDALPSDVYIKGFIRNLSRFLHTDGDALISEFIELRKAKISVEQGEVPSHNEENNAIGNIKSESIKVSLEQKRNEKAKKSNFLVTAVLILALLGAGAFYFMNKSGENLLPVNNSESTEKSDDAKKQQTEKPKAEEKKAETPVSAEPQKTAPPQAAQPVQPAQNAQNAVASQNNAAAPTNAQNAPIQGVEVVAGLDGASWIRVVVDGNVVFEDIAADGSVHTWKGKDSIIIRAGNAGAMKITHNGKNVGAMGDYGQIAEKVYSK